MGRVGACAVGALAIAVAAVASADAAVHVGPRRIVVDAGAAAAVVERSPVRISFRDARGRTVLAQIGNRRPGPLVEPLTVDPEPGGVDLLPETTLYAPLSFTVGEERIEQFPGPGPFVGDLLQAERSGVQYAARAVVGGTRAPEPVCASSLSTSDPSGRGSWSTCARWARTRSGSRRGRRRATGWPSWPTRSPPAATRPSTASAAATTRSTSAAPRSRTSSTRQNLVGRAARRRARTPGDRYLYPERADQAAYYVQSSFVSSRPLRLPARCATSSPRWRMASDRARTPGRSPPRLPRARLRRRARRAAPRAIAHAHRASPAATACRRAGRSAAARPARALPAADAAPPTSARSAQRPAPDPAPPTCRSRAYRIEALGVPAPRRSCAPDRALPRAGDPRAALLPRVRRPRRDRHRRPELLRRGARGAATSPRTRGRRALRLQSNFFADAALIDFTDPAALRWWTRRIREALDLGADGFMQDFGEQVMPDMHFHDGSTGRDDAQPLPGALPPRDAARDRRATGAHTRAAASLLLHARGLLGAAGLGGLRKRELPRRRDRPTGRGRRASPRRRPTCSTAAIGGAYGFDDGHRRLLRRAAATPTTKELFLRWAELGGADAVLSPARLGGRRHAHALELRRRDRADLPAR